MQHILRVVQETATKVATAIAKISYKDNMDSRSPFRTQEEALDFLRRIGMKRRRTLEGTEREHMLTLLGLLEPDNSSNNQRTFTETYYHAGKEYELTWGFDDAGPEPLIEEVSQL
jgi:hypothetical protein